MQIDGKIITVLVSVILLVGGISVLFLNSEKPEDISSENSIHLENKVDSEPIRIDSNSDFETEDGVSGGDGTQEDPWIISDLDINATGSGPAIYIGNVTDHFVIKNCYLHHATEISSPYHPGYGIKIYLSQNGVVKNNNASFNEGKGIAVSRSDGIKVIGNIVHSNNSTGFSSYKSDEVTFSSNTAISNGGQGINLGWSTDSSTISNNTFKYNDGRGFRMNGNTNNIIKDNLIYSNENYGFYLKWDNYGNLFYHNSIIDNTPAQCYIYEGSNDWDNGYPSGGNYWSDYTGDDNYSGSDQDEEGSDGIGDTPYQLDGNTDDYPLMEPMVSETDNQSPNAELSYSPSLPVVDETIQFTDLSDDPDGTIESWSWDFGDGNTSTEKDPVHTYGATGTYTVTLTVTDDDGESSYTSKEIKVIEEYNSPDLAIFEDEMDISDEILNGSSGGISVPVHQFGVTTIRTYHDGDYGEYDFEVSEDKTIDIKIKAGTPEGNEIEATGFRVKLDGETIYSDNLDTIYEIVTIESVDLNKGTHTLRLEQTTDGSHQNLQYDWIEFGDKHREAELFDRTGSYNGDSEGGFDQIFPHGITAKYYIDGSKIGEVNRIGTHKRYLPRLDVVEFGPEDSTEHFIINDGSVPISLNWTPPGEGEYNLKVNLTASYRPEDSDYSNNVIEKTIQVGSENNPPNADFDYSPENPTEENMIEFTDTSSDTDGTIVNWSWDFGDGETSTEKDPVHTYETEGTYTITLTVTDDDGESSDTSKEIKVIEKEYTDNPDLAIFEEEMDISDEVFNGSSGKISVPVHQLGLTNIRTFHDGDYGDYIFQTEEEKNISIKIMVGTNAESGGTGFELILDNEVLKSTTIKEEFELITVGKVNIESGSHSLRVKQTTDGYHQALKFDWIKFGENHREAELFDDTGTLNGDPEGGFDQIFPHGITADYYIDGSKIGQIDRIGTHERYLPRLDVVEFGPEDSSEHFIINGGSVPISLNWTPPGEGEYNLKVNITANYRPDDSNYTNNVIEKTIQVGSENTPPKADFVYSPSDPLTLSDITFTEECEDDGELVNWSWDFGDGEKSYGGSPEHSYEDDGSYRVTLTVTDDDGQKDNMSKKITVKNREPEPEIDVYKPIQVSLEVTGTPNNTVRARIYENGERLDELNITRSTGPPETENTTLFIAENRDYEMELGYSAERQGANPTKLYFKNAHSLAAITTLFNTQDGYEQTENHDIDDKLSLVGDTSTVYYFSGERSHDKDGSIVSYSWDFGDGTEDDGLEVKHEFSEEGKYEVKLTVEDDDGATSTREVDIEIDSEHEQDSKGGRSSESSSGSIPIVEESNDSIYYHSWIIVLTIAAIGSIALFLLYRKKNRKKLY